MQERQYLSVMMLGPNNSEILKTVSLLVAQHGCQIVNSHIISQGEHYHFSFFLSGEWGSLAKIEPRLKKLEQKYALTVFLKRTELKLPEKPHIPYVLYLVSLDDANIFHQLMRFLHQQSVIITEIYVDAYKTKQVQTPMTATTVKILLITDTALSDWRERFILFCDDLNIDAIMEPEKP
jgi:glycine cleavage system transcriptional repressor